MPIRQVWIVTYEHDGVIFGVFEEYNSAIDACKKDAEFEQIDNGVVVSDGYRMNLTRWNVQ